MMLNSIWTMTDWIKTFSYIINPLLALKTLWMHVKLLVDLACRLLSMLFFHLHSNLRRKEILLWECFLKSPMAQGTYSLFLIMPALIQLICQPLWRQSAQSSSEYHVLWFNWGPLHQSCSFWRKCFLQIFWYALQQFKFYLHEMFWCSGKRSQRLSIF